MKKVICLIMVVIFITSGFLGHSAKAAENEVEIPTFKVKKINGGTGVKIIINKTKGADGYHIYVTKRQNADSRYYNQNGVFESELDFSEIFRAYYDISIEKNGQKKRSHTINGLSKGKYSFKVAACIKDQYGDLDNRTYSEIKSVSIKAGKKVDRQELSYDFSSIKVGDVIKFGAYEQDDDMNNGAEPIEWVMLSADNKRIMAISKYVLDRLPYDRLTWSSVIKDEDGCVYTEGDNVEWDSIIDWLNNVFYKRAFTKNERKMIGYTSVNKEEDAEDGETIVLKPYEYKVALLTEEILLDERYGFSSDQYAEDIMRRCSPTEYAIAQGVRVSDVYRTKDGKKACSWWGMQTERWRNGCIVSADGSIYHHSYIYDEAGLMGYIGLGVRPVICIKLQ